MAVNNNDEKPTIGFMTSGSGLDGFKQKVKQDKMKDMSEFRITYDGPALEASEMDVRELAPALLAIGDLLTHSTQVLCGNKVKPQVNIKASFKTGSFGIDFVLSTDLLIKIRDLFLSENATATINAMEILALVGFIGRTSTKGLIQVIKWLKGRKIKKVQTHNDRATIFVEDEQLEIEISVLNLLRDIEVRKAAEAMLAPLKSDGINIFCSSKGSEIAETITDEEAGWFSAPPAQDELLIDEVRKMVFSIVSLAFKEDNKWRLYDGNSTISASIADEEFLHKVNTNQTSFAKGDILVCNVHVKQWQTDTGAKTEYEVIKVNEHRTSARQIQLPGL